MKKLLTGRSDGPTRAPLKLWIIWISIWKLKFYLILNLASILLQVNSFSPGKIAIYNLWDSNNSQNFKDQ